MEQYYSPLVVAGQVPDRPTELLILEPGRIKQESVTPCTAAAVEKMCEKVVKVSFETSLFENPVSVLSRIVSSFLLEVNGVGGLISCLAPFSLYR